MRKSRLELQNFTGRTVEAVQQEGQAAVLLAHLESLVSEWAQAALDQQARAVALLRKVHRANAYHALKDRVLDLLWAEAAGGGVLEQLMRQFVAGPMAVWPARPVPRHWRPSLHWSHHFQRRVKKVVF